MRKIEAATSKLKLARLRAEKAQVGDAPLTALGFFCSIFSYQTFVAQVPRHKAALVDVAECELKVKLLEEEVRKCLLQLTHMIYQFILQVLLQKVAVLKEQEESRKVVKARALEL